MTDNENPTIRKTPIKAWPAGNALELRNQKLLETKSVKQGRCLSWLKRKLADNQSTVRRCMSVTVLVIYSFLGSAVFYALERSSKNYWQCLAYANTIYTTIGYGSVKADTNSGKVFTIFYAIVGVPVMMVATSDLGLIMMYWIGKVWVQVRRVRRFMYRTLCDCWITRNSNVAVIKADDSAFKGKEDKLPLSFALIMMLVWLVMSSFYFWLTSAGWSFFIAFYFFFISVTTIGLGDYVMRENRPQVIVDYIFIIGGLSLFSLCVRLFIVKIETIDDKAAQNIIQEYRESLQSNYAFDAADGRVEQSEKEQRLIIRRLIKKKGGCFVRFFIAKRVEARLLKEYRKRANKRVKATQTISSSRNVAASVGPEMCEVQTMAGGTFVAKGSPAKKAATRRHPRSKSECEP